GSRARHRHRQRDAPRGLIARSPAGPSAVRRAAGRQRAWTVRDAGPAAVHPASGRRYWQVCYSRAPMQILPAINATLNGTSGVLLLIAYILIRRRKIEMHKRFMIAACVTSLVFLACYVLNHIL